MAKLKRGQRRGYPGLWSESGGEDKLVAGFTVFANLKKRISWNSPMWGDVAGMIFNDKSVKKKKWLYTIWHKDRKSVRTRTLLREKTKNVSSFQRHENINESDRREKNTEKIAFQENISMTKSDRDTVEKKMQTFKEKEGTNVVPEETTAEPLPDRKQSFSQKEADDHTEISQNLVKAESTLRIISDGDNQTKAKDKKAEQEKPILTHEGAEMANRSEDLNIEYSKDTLFCVCKQPNDPNEPYAQCSLCQDWFHPLCVGYQSVDDISVISPWYCPSCSKNPQKTNSGQMEGIKRSLAFESEVPSCPPNFSVSLTREEWSAIKPDEREGYRVLKKGWTDYMTEKIARVNKYCVLSFKVNKVKSNKSRKAKKCYWRGKAVCKFTGCANYSLSIEKDPDMTEGDIIVNVSVQGRVIHSCEEQHARHCTEPERQKIKDKLGELTPMLLHTKQLASADEDKLLSGNFNDVKSVQVLQKISSEKNLGNRLDQDIFIDCFELQQKLDAEEPSTKLKHSSIQYIAISPFVVHSYSESQLEILQDIQRSNSCLLYLDATGSVVGKPHPASQSVLYYAVCIECQSTTKTVVPVAEMISADQTTATILHWLTCLRRDFFKLFQKHLKPQKVETDFSWAMIHAIIQAFNTITVQEYLKICFQLCQENGKVEMTVLHLCAAHMLKLVSMKLAKMQCKKDIKRFFLYCFALLQNTSTFNHILSVMKSVVFVFSARKNTNGCQKHLSAFKDAINKQNADQIKVEMEDGEEDPDDSEKFAKSISKSSPFFGPIERIVRQTEHEAEEEDDTEKNGEPNPYCCESITDILLHYAGVVRLWTGIMLTALGKTRDSNAAVENWFRTTKTVILTSKLHRRAGDFLQVQHEFVVGRLKGVSLGKKRGLPMKSSAKEAQDTDGPEALPLTQEEQWHKRTTQKRKSRYYSAPPTRKKVKLSAPQQTKGCCPPWGGEGTIGDQTIKLTNTYTVDNLLYTIHLAIKRRSSIESDLQKHSHVDPWIATLLQVHDHFNTTEWGQGKLLWLNQIGRFKGQLLNAFGTEEDMVTYRLGFLLNTELAGKCQSPDCPVVKRISGSIDIL